MVQEYSPKIIGFCCRWCSYAQPDLVGALGAVFYGQKLVAMNKALFQADLEFAAEEGET